jgi:short-subunit dehydrogenase
MYLGAMFAVRGFLDALTSELYHDKVKITLTAVDLPAVKTPQFDRARKRMGEEAQPVLPAFPPELAARAICAIFAAFLRGSVWLLPPRILLRIPRTLKRT